MNPRAARDWGIAALGVVLAAMAGCSAPPPKPDEGVVRVRVAEARKGTVAVEVPVVGTVVPVEVSRVAAGSEGTVESFPLREGAFVDKDQVLAELRTVTLAIQIDAANALLREKEQRHAELAAGYREEEIAQALALMKASEAESIFASADLARIDELYARPTKPVTEKEREAAVYQAERARQAYAQAKADYEMKTRGHRAEVVEAARAAVEAQRMEVARLEDEKQKKTIRAPFSGYLVEKHIDVGEWVVLGGMVATLSKLDEVEVHVNVEESQIDQIGVGQKVRVLVDAVGDEPLEGTIRYIVPRTDWATGSRSFPVIVRLTNSIVDGQPRLKEGMIARIRFRGPQREALLAHKDAIVRTTGTPQVFVVGPQQRVRAVDVMEGISQDAYTEITGDVKEGEQLVTEGAERLRPFDKVLVLGQPAAGTTGEVQQAAKENAAAATSGG